MTETPNVRQLPGDPEQFAREFIVFIRDTPISLFGVPSKFFSDAGHILTRAIIRQLALSGPLGLQRVVLSARDGLQSADEVLREIIREHHIEGRAMPPYLQAYAADLVAGWTPMRRAGPRRQDRIFRDIGVVVVISEIVHRFRIRPTRNKWSATSSACSIVHRAW